MGVACRSVSSPHKGDSPTMRWPPTSKGLWSYLPAVLCVLATLCLQETSAADCELVGKGACRGDKWSEGVWPINVGKQSLEDCSEKCVEKEGCTGLSLSKTGDCLLYGHKKLVPASALGGECYSCADSGKDHRSPREEVLRVDRWLHPGLPVHLPADVDLQAGIRRVWPWNRPQKVLLIRLLLIPLHLFLGNFVIYFMMDHQNCLIIYISLFPVTVD